jgi:hypothetical protein
MSVCPSVCVEQFEKTSNFHNILYWRVLLKFDIFEFRLKLDNSGEPFTLHPSAEVKNERGYTSSPPKRLFGV